MSPKCIIELTKRQKACFDTNFFGNPYSTVKNAKKLSQSITNYQTQHKTNTRGLNTP